MSASARILTIISAFLFLGGIILPARAVPETTVTFSMADIDFSQTDGYDILNVEGCHLEGEPGQPLLPCKAINFVIPRGQDVSRVRVEIETKEHIPGFYYIYPAQHPRPTRDGLGDADFVDPDISIYNSDQPYPGTYLKEGDASMAWGWKTYQVTVWPLEYIPADREISLYETVKIFLELAPGTDNEQEVMPRSYQHHEEWAAELEQILANPEDVRPLAPNQFSGLLASNRWVLILPGAPLESIERDLWYNAFQPLINHRSNQGLDVEVKYVGEITSASGEAAVQDIRSYLYDQQTIHGARWACLVGDHDMIPWTYFNPSISPSESIPHDWCYCDLDGSWPGGMDWVPELWIGRIPAISTIEAQNLIEKILLYECNPGGGDYSYLNKAFYEYADIGQRDGTCDSVITHHDPNIEWKIWGEEPSWDAPEPFAPTDSMLVDTLNIMRYHYITVHCHGDVEGIGAYWPITYYWGYPPLSIFGIDDIARLTNSNYYNFWYTTICKGGYLDWADPSERSLAEGLLTCFDEKGAVVFSGNTRYGEFGCSANLQCFAWDMLFPQGPFTVWYFNYAGAIEALSKWKAYDSGLNSFYDKYVRYSHNLFGDPATRIWTPRRPPSIGKPLSSKEEMMNRDYSYLRCAPIPATNSVKLLYSLHGAADMSIRIYDMGGRLIRDFEERSQNSGKGTIQWDCSSVVPGAYFVRMDINGDYIGTRIIVSR